MKKIKNLLKKTNQCKGCLIIPCTYPSFLKKSVKNLFYIETFSIFALIITKG